jgi:hypothetical protein
MLSIRNRTPYILKIYAIYLYYSARSLRLASKCLELIKRSHVAIWKWLQYMMDINNLVIDRMKEKKRIKCVMIDKQ